MQHVFDESEFALAEEAVVAAIAAGASYADARIVLSRTETLDARDGELESVDRSEGIGLGVRALVGSSWGFAATSDLTGDSAGSTGAAATATAKASAMVPGSPLVLADVDVAQDTYVTEVAEDPFAVPLSEKVDLITGVTEAMRGVDGVAIARAQLRFWETRKLFVSSQGHRISQVLTESGGGMDATAVGERETQRRSYPQSFGHFEAGGFEVVRAMDLPGHAGRIAEEAVALLSAPECPAGTTTVVLEASQVALQIHESVGHAIELDRILGWEAAFAGTSFLDLEQLGSLTYGSEKMHIVADATLPRALGTFGYDDEGTPARSVPIVEGGRWVGVLSGRDTAHIAGIEPGGMVRADGYNRLPMVRMTNVGLLPGDSSFDEMIADTDDGIYMATNRSWSIDDKRLNFQFGCEVAWEIKGGRLGRMLRNPTYTGITPQFWAGLDRVGGEAEWTAWGLPNCGKGQPMQSAHTAHMASPCRFRDVRVGVQG